MWKHYSHIAMTLGGQGRGRGGGGGGGGGGVVIRRCSPRNLDAALETLSHRTI